MLLAKVTADSLQPQRSLNALRWRRPVSVNCAMKMGRYWIRVAVEHQTGRQAVESLSLPATPHIIIPLERLVMRRTESYLLSLITDTSAAHKSGQGAEAWGPAGERVATRGENKIPGKVSSKPREGKREGRGRQN